MYRHVESARHLTFSPDGTKLASGVFDGNILIWQHEKEDSVPTLIKGHSGPVRCLTYSQDGSVLYSASDDGTVKSWDVVSGRQRAKLTCPSRAYVVAFSPDESVLATGTAGTPIVKLWRAASEEDVREAKWSGAVN